MTTFLFASIYAMNDVKSNSENSIPEKQNWGALQPYIKLTKNGDYSTHIKLSFNQILLMFLIGFENDDSKLLNNLFSSKNAIRTLLPSTKGIQLPIGSYSRHTLLKMLEEIIKNNEKAAAIIFELACKHQLIKILKIFFKNETISPLVILSARQFSDGLGYAIENNHVEVVEVLVSVKGLFNITDLKHLRKTTKNSDVNVVIKTQIKSMQNQQPNKCRCFLL